MSEKKSRPEWVPKDGGDEYATYVISGSQATTDNSPGTSPCATHPRAGPSRKKLSVDEYVRGVIEGNRTILGRAITLVESDSPVHMEQAQEMLKLLLLYTGDSIRIGITGFPGAGKSTFIETLGTYLCEHGHKVAVLAVDPSSVISRGSILGDKTRMEKLGRDPRAFIRPSPSGGILGGVARKSRETIVVCEAAGYDVLLVETVGVGQSEVAVRSLVDFFLLLIIPGAGDELQGIKRGIMEITDIVVVNKADGDNKIKAEAAKAEFKRVLHYLQPATEGWKTEARTCSALTGEGIPEIWAIIKAFREQASASGVFANRRKSQTLDWVRSMVEEHLRKSFFSSPAIMRIMPKIEQEVLNGEISPTNAVKELIHIFEEVK